MPVENVVASIAITFSIAQFLLVNTVIGVWISVAILSLIGIFGLATIVAFGSRCDAGFAYATSLALAYGYGSLNTMTSIYVTWDDFSSVTYASVESLGWSLANILMICGLLYGFSNRNERATLAPKVADSAARYGAISLLVIFTGASILAVAMGYLSLQGAQNAASGSRESSPLASLVASSITAVVAASLWLWTDENKSRTEKVVLAISCSCLLAIQATQGRRVLIYSFIVCAIAYVAGRKNSLRLNTRTIVATVLACLLLFSAMRLFYSMRVATREQSGPANITEALAKGWVVYRNSELFDLDAELAENSATRTFILGYVGELVQASSAGGAPAFGKLAQVDLATVVPTVLWPGKWKLMDTYGGEEDVCHPLLAMPVWDAPNTLLTAGFCDFRWLGFYLYPLLVLGLLKVSIRFFQSAPLNVKGLVFFATLEVAFQVENQMTAYLISVRNIIIVAAVSWAITLLWHARVNR